MATSQTKRVLFCGLDPVPVPMLIADGASEEEMCAAACMPSSVFIQTVRPYRLRALAADRVELIVGPEGFGGVLLEALQWMARVTAAGILGVMAQERVVAFVKQVLERDKPEWRFEELTEHVQTFVDDRYQRATNDTAFRQALSNHRDDPILRVHMADLQAWSAHGN